jgi:hypothetical protein
MLSVRCPWAVSLVIVWAICGRLCADTSDADLNRFIRPYSTQRIVALDVGESFSLELNNGTVQTL